MNRIANDPQFDLEQQIMSCWNVTSDIDALFEGVCDHDPALTEDQISNALLGMRELYELKFNKLFHLFEETIKFKRQQLDETKEQLSVIKNLLEQQKSPQPTSTSQIEALSVRNIELSEQIRELKRINSQLTADVDQLANHIPDVRSK
jgi:archaellum component FlaC